MRRRPESDSEMIDRLIKRRPTSEAIVKRAAALREADWTWTEIAAEIGGTEHSILKVMNRHRSRELNTAVKALGKSVQRLCDMVSK